MLREQDLEQLMNTTAQFARRQPALFLGAAFALGFAATRFIKSSAPSSSGHMRSGDSGLWYERPDGYGTSSYSSGYGYGGAVSDLGYSGTANQMGGSFSTGSSGGMGSSGTMGSSGSDMAPGIAALWFGRRVSGASASGAGRCRVVSAESGGSTGSGSQGGSGTGGSRSGSEGQSRSNANSGAEG